MNVFVNPLERAYVAFVHWKWLKRDLLYAYQGLKDTTKGKESVEDHLLTSITQGAGNLHSDEDIEDKIKQLDSRVQKLIRTYLEVFGELPPPASWDKLVQMDLKLKPRFVGHKIRRRPYPAPEEHANEFERQIQECIDAGLVVEYKDGDYPQHCSPWFLVAKSGSTAKRLVVDYGELNKKTLNHSGSIPNMESTVEKTASCRYKTKMDKRSGFSQVDRTPNAQELLAFITPQGRLFKWEVMPFGVANAPAPFQELMNKILSILRRRPKVQELISHGAQMEAHIDDVCLGTNTQGDHLIQSAGGGRPGPGGGRGGGGTRSARCRTVRPGGQCEGFFNETTLPAVRALNGAGAPTLLPAMHRMVNAVQPGLISPEAALYGHWMEWRESNRSGWPLSMGDTLRLMGAGSAMSLRSSAPALLHSLRTRYPGDAAPYLNQARATYPGGVSELDAALHLLHPPDEDLGVGEVTVFVEGADEAPARPRPTNPVYDGTRPTPPYAIVCEAFPREPAWCPALPPATHAPRGWANPDLSPPLSRTRGAHHRGQVLWQECPGTPLLLLVVATRGDPGRILGITPTHVYGATPVPRPPLPAPVARDGVHTFLRTQEVNAVTGVHLVRLPPTPQHDPWGPRALGPATDGELWRDTWAAWLPRLPSQCRWMAAGPRPCGADATAVPPPPPPLPPAEHHTPLPTERH